MKWPDYATSTSYAPWFGQVCDVPLSAAWLLFVFGFKVGCIGSVTSARAGNRITLLVKLHTEVQPHSVQDFFYLVKRLLAEVFGRQHLALAPLDQIANGSDI